MIVYFLLALLILLAVADGWTTRRILKGGGAELNPILKFLIGKMGLDAAIVVTRLLVVALGAFAAASIYAVYFLAAMDLIFIAVVTNNLLVMRRMGLL